MSLRCGSRLDCLSLAPPFDEMSAGSLNLRPCSGSYRELDANAGLPAGFKAIPEV